VLWGWVFLLITPIFLLVSYAISKTAIEARWDGDDEKGNQRSRWAWNVTLTAGASFIFGAALIMLSCGSTSGSKKEKDSDRQETARSPHRQWRHPRPKGRPNRL
jgi:uncharacterized membrane protein